MKNKKTSNFFFIIIAAILGFSLFKDFDFENFKFNKPALAILYLIVFAFSIYGIVRNSKKEVEK